MPRRPRKPEAPKIEQCRTYSPEELFLLPPEFKLPPIGTVMGPDGLSDLRTLFQDVTRRNPPADSDIDNALEGDPFRFLSLRLEYESSEECNGMRWFMGVMPFEEFRTQFSPLVPILIGVLGRTYASTISM